MRFFIDNGIQQRIEKYSSQSDEILFITNVTDHCLALFVNQCNNLYFIIEYNHQVMKISLNSD